MIPELPEMPNSSQQSFMMPKQGAIEGDTNFEEGDSAVVTKPHEEQKMTVDVSQISEALMPSYPTLPLPAPAAYQVQNGPMPQPPVSGPATV